VIVGNSGDRQAAEVEDISVPPDGIDAAEAPEQGEDVLSRPVSGRRVVARADDCWNAGLVEALEAVESDLNRLSGRVESLEEIPGVNDGVGLQLEDAIDGGVERLVDVLLALVAAGRVALRQVSAKWTMRIATPLGAHPGGQ
jgi:hypothetical protein